MLSQLVVLRTGSYLMGELALQSLKPIRSFLVFTMASDVMNLLATEVQYAKWDMGTCQVGRWGVREGSVYFLF